MTKILRENLWELFLAMLKFNYCLLNWCEEMIIISRYTSLLVELNLIFISTLFSNGFVNHSVKLHCCIPITHSFSFFVLVFEITAVFILYKSHKKYDQYSASHYFKLIIISRHRINKFIKLSNSVLF